jgi:glycosyltransferase involved in cell wall biosynthesis
VTPPSTARSDSRLRVLTLALEAGSGYGGAEKLAYEFALRLDPARFKSYLCTIRDRPDRREAIERDRAELAAADVEYIELRESSEFPLRPAPWRRLYAILRREGIDVVHAHMPRASVPGSIVARLARVPVMISHEHGSAITGKRIRPFLDRHVVARLSTVMLVVSEWDRRQLIELERIAPERIGILHNGIASPPDAGPDVRPAMDLGPEDQLIGAVGRLYPEKAYDDLVRAVALLDGSVGPVTCAIVGIGPEEQALRALIDQLGVGDRVRLVGRRQDVPDFIRALDVAVMCSRREGSPLALLEYMAGAAPIVATAVGGVPEAVQDSVTGLLVAPGDPAGLARAIGRMLGDRELARRLGDAARARQRAEYDLGVVIDRLQELYVTYRRCGRLQSSVHP